MIWVAAVKGYTNRYFSKLCRYYFVGNNVRVEFYYFDQANIVDSGIKVGTNSQTPRCFLNDDDKLCDIKCQSGIAGQPTIMTGVYFDNGINRTITFDVGGTEVWTQDSMKWTLSSASYCPNDCWGWAFLVNGCPAQLDYTKVFTGSYQRYNGWSGVNEPLRNDAFYMGQLLLTSTGALRFVQWDPSARSWVFRYMAFIADRVIYQISHDFNNDGKIDGEKGHTYVGYPIFRAGEHRGFVFADVSEVVGKTGTFGAMYYFG